MPEGNHLILRTMDDEDRTADGWCIIYIRELVPRDREPEVESDAVRAQQRALQYDARHAPALPRRLGGEVAARSRPERPPVQDYLLRLELPHGEEVAVRRLYVRVARLLVGRPLALPIPGVIVRHYVHAKDAR